MRYIVYTCESEPKKYSMLKEAAIAAVDDPEGSRMSIYDSREKRWISGAEIILAYISGRKRNAG